MTILNNTIIINFFIFFITLIYTLLLKNKNRIWITWIFVYLILVSSILEQLVPPVCKEPTFFTSLYGVLHIILSLYIGLGGLFFGYHKIHLTVVLFIISSWFIFNNKCYLQIKYNDFCKLDRKEPFKDIQNIFFHRVLKVKSKIYKWLLIIIVILYDLYHILY